MHSAFRDSYTRLSDGLGSPTERYSTGFSPPFRSEYEANAWTRTWQSVKEWWRRTVLGQPYETIQPSAYLTLIPLNDSRLQPRRTLLIAISVVILCCALVTATFFLVPRGVGAGPITVAVKKSYWTGSEVDFSILVRVPIINPNYFPGKVTGEFQVEFYDAIAATKVLNRTSIPARSLPHVLTVEMDVVKLPEDYSALMLSICTATPRRIIFFLKGSLQLKVAGQKAHKLPPIDTYFMADCLARGNGLHWGAAHVGS